jgi:hypothetical protein
MNCPVQDFMFKGARIAIVVFMSEPFPSRKRLPSDDGPLLLCTLG